MSEHSELERNDNLQEIKKEERSRGKVEQPKGQFKNLFVKGPNKEKVSGNGQTSKAAASSQKR